MVLVTAENAPSSSPPGGSVGIFDGLNPPYRTLVADPPWRYNKTAGTQHTHEGRGRSAERHYGTMTPDSLLALPVESLADGLAHLYLWTTNPKLRLAFDVMEAWGFTYQTTLTWVKVAADGSPIRGGLGWYFRGATEHVLFGTRGRAGIPAAMRQPNVVMARRSRHSSKPSEFFDLVEQVSPGPYVELFARTTRPAWDGWGNELEAA